MSENMRIWDAVKRPPKDALKQITAGRLKGKSDISPQWRIQIMTEQFGPVGFGWQYEIKRVWSETIPGSEIFAFAEVQVRYRLSDKDWSEWIPGIGGSKLLQKETNGLYANDEGYKMAVTDAIGVALKALGVAADIYAGKWDGSKYVDLSEGSKPATSTPTAQSMVQDILSELTRLKSSGIITAAEGNAMYKRAKSTTDMAVLKNILAEVSVL